MLEKKTSQKEIYKYMVYIVKSLHMKAKHKLCDTSIT